MMPTYLRQWLLDLSPAQKNEVWAWLNEEADSVGMLLELVGKPQEEFDPYD